MDDIGGFELAEEGTRMGCCHCQGVLALCYLHGFGCEIEKNVALMLAHNSSERGSKYGQYVLGLLYFNPRDLGGKLIQDLEKARVLYRLAADQCLDAAQHRLGILYYNGNHVPRDYTEALPWLMLAAAQGYPDSMYAVALCHEKGFGVVVNVAEAICWYKRSQAAGVLAAAAALRRLDEE
jgi:TPR repeat protein